MSVRTQQICRASGEIGRLNWSPLRNFVLHMQHKGSNIQMTEGSGWISRPFYLVGTEEDLSSVRQFMKHLTDDN